MAPTGVGESGKGGGAGWPPAFCALGQERLPGPGGTGLPSHTPSRPSTGSPSDLTASSGQHPRATEPRGGQTDLSETWLVSEVEGLGLVGWEVWGAGLRRSPRAVLPREPRPTPSMSRHPSTPLTRAGRGWAGESHWGGVRETEAHCPAWAALLVLGTLTCTCSLAPRGQGHMSRPLPGTTQREDPTLSLPPVGRTSWPSLGVHPRPRADGPTEPASAGWAGGLLVVLAFGGHPGAAVQPSPGWAPRAEALPLADPSSPLCTERTRFSTRLLITAAGSPAGRPPDPTGGGRRHLTGQHWMVSGL